MLCLAAAEEAGRQYGRPSERLAAAALLAGGLIVLRWVLACRWRFGPRL